MRTLCWCCCWSSATALSLLAALLLVVVGGGTQASPNNNATVRKYPSKEVYRQIHDRLQVNRRSLDYESAWSQWSSWSPCSRTCGGGVSAQTRECRSNIRRRRSVTGSALRNRRTSSSNSSSSSDDPNHLNSLDATNNMSISGNVSGSGNHSSRPGCVGLYKRYHMCNTQECPAGSIDFRQQQCESHNNKLFMGKYYIWEAYWDGENPCELNCRALTFRFYALLNKTVVDGTRCRPNDASRICVSGTCKAIGCDGIVGSEKRPDACGVCGGNNSTCQIISGIFTEPKLPAGYNLVAQLPKGACHINITEFKPSRNYLALRRLDGSFVFNGNWAINWSGEYQAAGALFTYRRQDANTPELISAVGPLTEPIDLMVIYQQINPGIKYEYMLPLGVANNLIPQRPSFAQQSDQQNGANFLPNQKPGRYPPEATGTVLREPPLSPPINYPNPTRISSLGAEGGLFQAIGSGSATIVGLSGTIQNSPSINNAPPVPSYPTASESGTRTIPSSLSSSGSLANLGIAVPQQFDPPASDFGSSAPVGIDTTATFPPPPLKDVRPTDQPLIGGRNGHNKRRHHGHKQHHSNTSGSNSAVSLLESQGKLGAPDLQGTDANVPTAAPPSHRRGPRRHSGGKGFIWKQVGFSECSKTCGGGVQQALIVCVREHNQVPVADHRCKEEDRLPSETVRCNTKPCPAEWVLSDWSSCSATCGDGIQTRDLTCKQEISATLTMRVNEAACLNAAPSLPRVRSCNLGACAKWQASEWSKCSTTCGKGMRHRRVFCQGFDGRDSGDGECMLSDKPTTSEVCDMGSCSTGWFFTEWSEQCSEECGPGIQTRKVHCSGANEVDCDNTKKPDTSRTCVSTKDCSGKWFAGPWSQCSATCGDGTQTRDVICLTFIRGQYRVGLDIQCSAKGKPNATASCNLGRCLSQWYTSDWSECSATCGTGAQRREVKCLDANQVPSHDCREDERPLLRHACNARACNEVPGADDNAREAQDTPIISVESNRNDTEAQEVVKTRKNKHHKLSKGDSTMSGSLGSSAATFNDEAPGAANSPAAGEGCVDKFKNCHLVVQARLCKLKYYLVSCCASCSKPKT